jgi:GDP-D-mannose dehydratase
MNGSLLTPVRKKYWKPCCKCFRTPTSFVRWTSWKTLVAVDEAYFRPSEVPALIGDASKAAQQLGWTPKIGLEEIIQEMVASDIHRSKAVPLSLKA